MDLEKLNAYIATKRADFAPKSCIALEEHFIKGEKQSQVARRLGMSRSQMNGLVNGFRSWSKEMG